MQSAGRGDGLEHLGAVEGADRADYLALGERVARGHDRLPPSRLAAAQP